MERCPTCISILPEGARKCPTCRQNLRWRKPIELGRPAIQPLAIDRALIARRDHRSELFEIPEPAVPRPPTPGPYFETPAATSVGVLDSPDEPTEAIEAVSEATVDDAAAPAVEEPGTKRWVPAVLAEDLDAPAADSAPPAES